MTTDDKLNKTFWEWQQENPKSPQALFINRILLKIKRRKGLDDFATLNYKHLIPDDPSNTSKLIENFQKYCNDIGIRVDCGVAYEKAVINSEKLNKQKSKQKDTEEQQEIQTSFYEDKQGRLYEQVKGHKFVVYDPSTEKISYTESIFENGLTTEIKPIVDELELKEAVLLPTKAEDFGTIQEFLREIEDYINTYCDLNPDFVKFASWYVLLTAVTDKLNTVPYLRFLGDTGTGKSRAVDIIGRICYKPMLANACITPAPIYRMINQWNGTLILEEADIRKSDETNEVIKILNAGFERGKPVLRSTKDSPDKIQVLPVFCAKVFATRRRFNDSALEARCLTEITKETQRKDIPPLLPKKAFDEQEKFRNRLLMFRFKYRHTINTDTILNVDFGELEPRLKQVASSFAVIFSSFPEVLEEFKQVMAKYQVELIEIRSLTFEGQVVASLLECMRSHVTNVTNVTDVTITATDIAESECMPSERGQKPNSRTIGKCLKTLGLSTKLVRIENKSMRVINLDPQILMTLIKRYIPLDEQENAVTCVTSVTCVTCDREVKGNDKYEPEIIEVIDPKSLREEHIINVIRKLKSKGEVFTDDIAKEIGLSVGEIYPLMHEMKSKGGITEINPDRWVVLE